MVVPRSVQERFDRRPKPRQMPWQLSWTVLEQEAEDRRHRRISRLRRESRLPSGKTWETFEHDRVPLALRAAT